MKYVKMFMLLAMSVMTVSMSAAINAKAEIKIAGAYTSSTVNIYQDDAATQLVDCIDQSLSGYGVKVYAEINGSKYSSVKQADLHNLVIKFRANKYETSYTVSFSDVLGDIKLVKGEDVIPVDAATPYALTCAVNEVVTFTVQTQEDYGQYSRTEGVAAGNFGTICLPKAVAAGDATGATFYSIVKKVEAAGTIVGLELAEETALVAGRPYIFQATASEIVCKYHDNVEELTAGSYNGLVGTYELTTADLVANNAYIIYNNEVRKAGVAAWIGDNRAVIVLEDIQDASATAPARRRVISFTNGVNVTTGVENAELNANAQKMIIDGQMYILRGENIYNMNGQVVK